MKTRSTNPRPRSLFDVGRWTFDVLLLASLLLGAAAAALGQATIQFSASTYPVAENAGSVTLTVRRTGAVDTLVTVDYATADGTATAGLDYTAVAGTLTFAVGETNQTIGVPILNDAVVETGETFEVTLSHPSDGAVLGARPTATVRLTDNDTGLQFEFASDSVAENAGSILIDVGRGDDGDLPVSVGFATADGTATNGLDYTAVGGTLFFAAGEKSKTLAVPILNDGLKELNETFRVTLSNPTNQVLGSRKTTLITIRDNDPGVQFEFNRYWVQETDGPLTVKVFRGNDGQLGPFTVDYAASDLTATNGVDYSVVPDTLSFAEGEMVQALAVPIRYDEQLEPDRRFVLTLRDPSGALVLGPNTNATITILDTTGLSAHRFEAIAARPDRRVLLTLGGGVSQRFKSYFDLYPIEVSSNLVDWTLLVTLQRTNASTNALTFTDPEPPDWPTRFYRTPGTNLITPFFLQPTGPFQAGVVARVVTDPTRNNRYGVRTNSSFMVSVWYPGVAQARKLPHPFEHPELARDPNTPYGAWATFVDRMPYLVGYALPDLACATNEAPYPILLYSPGSTGDHAHATERAAYLASHGYVVVGIEHADCFATVFPDGTRFYGADNGVSDRVQDMVFVLDELTRWNGNDPLFAGRLDLTKVAAMGASYGGETVAKFGAADSRCQAVIALDPSGSSSPLRIPLLEITTPEFGDTGLYDWATSDAIWFQLKGATHQQGGTDFYWAIFQDPAGLAYCREAARTMIAYELWFLNKYLKGIAGPPLPLSGFTLVTGFKQK